MNHSTEVKRETIKCIVAVESFFLVLILALAISTNFNLLSIIISIALCIGYIPLFKEGFELFIRDAIIEKKLSKWIEVIPIKNELNNEFFPAIELSKRVKFFGRLVGEFVIIRVKLKGEKEMFFYDQIDLDNFSEFYEIM